MRLKALKLTLQCSQKALSVLSWKTRGDGSVVLSQDECEMITYTLKGIRQLALTDIHNIIKKSS